VEDVRGERGPCDRPSRVAWHAAVTMANATSARAARPALTDNPRRRRRATSIALLDARLMRGLAVTQPLQGGPQGGTHSGTKVSRHSRAGVGGAAASSVGGGSTQVGRRGRPSPLSARQVPVASRPARPHVAELGFAGLDPTGSALVTSAACSRASRGRAAGTPGGQAAGEAEGRHEWRPGLLDARMVVAGTMELAGRLRPAWAPLPTAGSRRAAPTQAQPGRTSEMNLCVLCVASFR
jgi:hypothetical protein